MNNHRHGRAKNAMHKKTRKYNKPQYMPKCNANLIIKNSYN